MAPGKPFDGGIRISLKCRRVAVWRSVKKGLFAGAASGTSGVMGRGLTSASPRIHGTGPGAAGANGGDCPGVEGATGAAVCCPSTAFADIDAAIIALTKSRLRMGLSVPPANLFRTPQTTRSGPLSFLRSSEEGNGWRKTTDPGWLRHSGFVNPSTSSGQAPGRPRSLLSHLLRPGEA